MRKKLLLAVFVLISYFASAQFYMGGSFAENSTWLLNKAVFDRGSEQDIAASFGNNYGIVAGMKFSDNLGVEINFLFNTHTQNYTGTSVVKPGPVEFDCDYTSKSTYHSIDIPILFKTGDKAYFEIGPQLSLLQSARFEINYSDNCILNDEARENKEDYTSTFFGFAMGFGGNIDITDNFKLTLGLRLYYGISDIGGVNAWGWNKETTTKQDDNYNILNPDDDNHYGHKDFKTNPAAGGLRIGLIYVID
jgi:opacity protein-like surface antigen